MIKELIDPILITAILAVFVLANIAFTMICFRRLKQEKAKNAELYRRLNEVSWDVKGLYDSSKGVGNRLHSIERRTQALEETQEQFTLKDPSHQTYQNAMRMMNDGASVEKISESSGLSKGEIELLSLLRKIEGSDSLSS